MYCHEICTMQVVVVAGYRLIISRIEGACYAQQPYVAILGWPILIILSNEECEIVSKEAWVLILGKYKLLSFSVFKL